jgi:hypothetical protein
MNGLGAYTDVATTQNKQDLSPFLPLYHVLIFYFWVVAVALNCHLSTALP